MRFFVLIHTFLFFTIISSAQSLSNYRTKIFQIKQDTITVDSLSLVHASLIAKTNEGHLIPVSDYHVLEAKSQVIFKPEYQNQTVELSYRVLPIQFEVPSYGSLYELQMQTDSNKAKPYIFPSPFATTNEVYPSGQSLNKSGYISRGLNFGNNQDVVVNSALNMQLSGQLSDGIKIKASITDNNIPIQPDGNTQQIQEFDKIFITLYNKNTSLTLGDFIIDKPKGYFLNANKKVMGATAQHQFDFKNNKANTLNVRVSGAVAKGKFNRMEIKGQEGARPLSITWCQQRNLYHYFSRNRKGLYRWRITTPRRKQRLYHRLQYRRNYFYNPSDYYKRLSYRNRVRIFR